MGHIDHTNQLAIVELVIYLVLVPIILYVLLRHGRSGYLGWGFLLAFCGLRLAADGIGISNHDKAAKGVPVGASGAIVNTIGLSALLYGLAGIINEAWVLSSLSGRHVLKMG